MKKAREKKSSLAECTLDGSQATEKPITSLLSGNAWIEALCNRYVQIVVLLSIVGFILRFYNISFNSIWLDEAATYNFANNSFLEIWEITARGEFNPPLFHWIEHIMLFFGKSEFVLRFVPALLGALSVPLFYLLGRELYDRNAGVIAAAILVFSPFHIYYSQDARAYTTVLFFFSLALLFYARAMKSGNLNSWILFGVFSALSFWTHFYVFIAIAVLYIFAIVAIIRREGGKLKATLSPWIISLVVYVVGTLPLTFVTIRLFLTRTAAAPTYGVRGFQIVSETITQFSGFSIPAIIVMLVLFALGLVQFWKSRRENCLLIAMVLLVTFLSSFVLSYSMPMIPRYLIFLLPFFFITIGASYNIIYSVVKRPEIIYLLIVILVLINVPSLAVYYTTPSKEDWRGVAAVLPSATQPGDIVVLMPSYLNMPLEYYYSNTSDGTVLLGASNLAQVDAIKSKNAGKRIWYIVTADITATDPSGETFTWLEGNTQYMGERTGIVLFLS